MIISDITVFCDCLSNLAVIKVSGVTKTLVQDQLENTLKIME